MSRLRKVVMPFSWNTITANFTQGTAALVNLASYLNNPRSLTIAYSALSGLPSGVTLSGSLLSYDGVGVSATASVQFRATNGAYSAESAVTTVRVNAAAVTNQPPVWTGGDPINLGTLPLGTAGVFPLAGYASDVDGPLALVFGRTGAAPDTGVGSITVGSTYPANATFPSSLPAGTHIIEVYVRLNWDDPNGTETSYRIERLVGATWTPVATVGPDVITHTVTGLTASTAYSFRVYATGTTGQSDYSNTATATTNSLPVLGDPEADWILRSTGSGVVFWHDFRSYAEIQPFIASDAIVNDAGVSLKPGRHQDESRANPLTYETANGYLTQFGFFQGETKPKASWPDLLPNVGSGMFIAEYPDALAWNNWPEGTWFRWGNAIETAQAVFPDGTYFPSETTNTNRLNFHRMKSSSGAWTRPLAPLTAASCGKAASDPGVSGSITPYTYPNNPVNLGGVGAIQTWRTVPRGFWSHASVDPGDGSVLGHEYWLQMRVWVDPNQFLGRVPVTTYSAGPSPANRFPTIATWGSGLNPSPGVSREYLEPGKMIMLARHSELNGEWVQNAGIDLFGNVREGYETERYIHYTNSGSFPAFQYPSSAGPSYTNRHWQTGPAHAGSYPVSYHDTCRVNSTKNTPNACWEQPVGEWWTLMLRWKPGIPNPANVNPAVNFDTHVEIRVARWGETDWTYVFYDENAPWWFATTGAYPRGHSTLRLTTYRNEVPYWASVVQAFTQVIFSTQEIPCPQVY
jgi:hypothetical protein